MSRGTNQKFKFTYLMKIMQEKTDDEHSLTMPQIMEELEKYDVTAERKSIYADFQDMTDKFGVEIIKEQIGRETYYHVGAREFELAEVKLLIDAIQSSKFITQTKSRELITKIKSFVSEHQAKQLQRQVYINDRVKTMNESVYYNVDDIHTAINQNKKIRFKYYKWDINKKLVPRHNGDWFVVSPWALTWDDENYYLVGYDSDAEQIKHYRVDKMLHIQMSEEKREGKEHFKKLDMADYAKKSFGMFGGKEQEVKLRVANNLAGVIIDRFGKNVMMIPEDEEHFTVNVDVHVSKQFLGWIFSLGESVRIVGPSEVVAQMKEEIGRLVRQYDTVK